jgi:hypothetical protein
VPASTDCIMDAASVTHTWKIYNYMRLILNAPAFSIMQIYIDLYKTSIINYLPKRQPNVEKTGIYRYP